MTNTDKSQLSALLGDLIAHSFALLSENKSTQRFKEIRAIIHSIECLIDRVEHGI